MRSLAGNMRFFCFWQVSSHVLGYRMITSKGQSCATRCFLFEALIDLLDVYKRFSRVHSFKETSINNFLINSLRQPCRLCIVSLCINFRIAIAISGRETKGGKIRGISDTFSHMAASVVGYVCIAIRRFHGMKYLLLYS